MNIAPFLTLAIGALPAAAQPVWQGSSHSQARLVLEYASLLPGQSFRVGLWIRLRPGWHTYWRNPGDSAAAPILKWRHSDKIELGAPIWPFPERIRVGPLVNYGYNDEFFLIVPAKLSKNAGAAERMELEAEWLVCEKECIPQFERFSLNLPIQRATKPDTAWNSLFSRFRSRLPQSAPAWDFEALWKNGKLRIGMKPPRDAPDIRIAEFFPYHHSIIENAAEQELNRDDNGWVLTLQSAGENAEAPSRLTGILVVNRSQAYELDLPAAAASGLGTVLVLAFAGGLLLNLMPCVFPVLSIKVLGFLKHSHSSQARIHALAFAFGVLCSFWLLAGALLFLRAQGESIGWGFQMQSPWFLCALALVFTALGLNLLGFFEVGIRLTRLAGLASGREGLRASLLSGVLAAVAATPCTAPFMGTAIGAALALPTWAALGAFTALALGMSLPYVALTFHPAGLRWLPRPGPWMEALKQALGFPLLATSVWLLWVLGKQADIPWMGQVSAVVWILALAAWIWTKFPSTPNKALAGFIVFLGFWAALRNRQAPTLPWKPYSEERLQAELAGGREVFVNFTAAWCVTCQVNERIAFANPRVRQALKKSHLALLKADWTSRNPEITAALGRLGQSGVPTYALFSRDGPAKLLPAVLTPGIVIDAVEGNR